MNEREAVVGVAVGAERGFADAAAVDLHRRAEGAHHAAEESLAHLRHDVRRADHHAADGNQLVDVWNVQRAR